MYDVIVVGAGPAGSITANNCAKAGLNTLLIDKARFPREKPCGGAISVRALNALKFAGITVPNSIIEQKIFGLQFIGPEGIPFEYRSPQLVACTVKRSTFDEFLVKQAIKSGVHFQQNCTVTDLKQQHDRVICQTETEQIESKLLIGADGATSTIRRKTGLPKPMKPQEVGLAVETDVPVSEAIWKQGLDPSLIVFWLPNIPNGYFWVFPRRQSVSVGVGGMVHKLGNVPNLLRRLSRLFCEQYDIPSFELQNLRGHMLPVFRNFIPLTTQRVLLVGDSAGFIDTFSGQGICYALEGGLFAAKTASDILNRHHPISEAFDRYRNMITQRFGKELYYSWSVMRIVHAHLYGGFRAARFMKWTGQLLFDIAQGKTDYYRMRRNPARFLFNILKSELRSRLLGHFD